MYEQLIRDYVPKDEFEAKDQEAILDYIKDFSGDVASRQAALAHLTASGFIMNEALDKVLMVHHNIYQTWAWTGGHADGGHDLFQVALREAKEETGIEKIRPLSTEVMSLDILPVFRHHKNGVPVNAHLHLNVSFLLIANESEPLKVKEDENSGVAWIPVEDVPKYSGEPLVVPIYQKLIKKARELTR